MNLNRHAKLTPHQRSLLIHLFDQKSLDRIIVSKRDDLIFLQMASEQDEKIVRELGFAWRVMARYLFGWKQGRSLSGKHSVNVLGEFDSKIKRNPFDLGLWERLALWMIATNNEDIGVLAKARIDIINGKTKTESQVDIGEVFPEIDWV